MAKAATLAVRARSQSNGMRATAYLCVAVGLALLRAVAADESPTAVPFEELKPLDEVHEPVEEPPSAAGCYRYKSGDQWRAVKCPAEQHLKERLLRPEAVKFIGVGESAAHDAPPFKSATVRVRMTPDLFPEEDVNPLTGAAMSGPDAYSIQINVPFTGNNGQVDEVQFVNEAWPLPVVSPFSPQNQYDNIVCVWQIANVTQNYQHSCIIVMADHIINSLTGYIYNNNSMLGAVVDSGKSTYWAVGAPDMYGLAMGNRWNSVSGTVLGRGNSSEASFAGGKGIASTWVLGAACREANILSYPHTQPIKCSHPLGKRATSTPSPYVTLESNNLKPVTGDPAHKLPPFTYPNPYAVMVAYAATLSGKCPTGKPPLCGMK